MNTLISLIHAYPRTATAILAGVALLEAAIIVWGIARERARQLHAERSARQLRVRASIASLSSE